jgi:vacuolar-type H+-ATPase subunit I/STV1
LLKPIYLPSGKVIDLDKCLAIVPSSTSPDSEVVLSGIEHHIQIDAQDVETLRRELRHYASDRRQSRNLFLERTEAEKKELADKLEEFNLKWNRLAARENAQEEAEIIRQIIDAERPSGQKLFSEE